MMSLSLLYTLFESEVGGAEAAGVQDKAQKGIVMRYRAEIISNQSVEDDITELLEQEIPEIEYTVLPVVHGRGRRTQKQGNTIWPEQNFALFAYLSHTDALKVKAIVNAVKAKFPDEGISLFFAEEVELGRAEECARK